MILASALLAAQISMAEPRHQASPFVQTAMTRELSCREGVTPKVKVSVSTEEIEYDYTKTSRQLSAVKTDTKSPYPPGSDTVTEGLRSDAPSIESKVLWLVDIEQRSKMGCMQYKSVDVNIHLQPKILIARDYNRGACREAILKHERKHVEVDREVMNKYARVISKAVKSVIDRAGTTGPFPIADRKRVQKKSYDDISRTIDHIQKVMMDELQDRQQEVDNLHEYESVAKICRNVNKGDQE